MNYGILAAIIALAATTQAQSIPTNIPLHTPAPPGHWAGSVPQSATAPTSVLVELDGRDEYDYAVTNDSPNGVLHVEFSQTQHMRVQVGDFAYDQDGDPAHALFALRPGQSDHVHGFAVFNIAQSFAAADLMRQFVGDGVTPVRIDWDVWPAIATQSYHDKTANAFDGRCNVIRNFGPSPSDARAAPPAWDVVAELNDEPLVREIIAFPCCEGRARRPCRMKRSPPSAPRVA